MAARLLDNEALSQDYEIATLADILRDHVTPYGVTVGAQASMGAVSQFSVAAGSSEWSVLYDFARYYNGIYPRFDQLGRLILTPWSNEARVVLDSTVPVTRLVCRDRRYGVLSQVVVRDRYQDWTETVDNPSFQALGGRRRQVITMPGKGQYQAMRYSGQFQLEQSAAEQPAPGGGGAQAVFRKTGRPGPAGPAGLGAQRAVPGGPGSGGPGRAGGVDRFGAGAPGYGVVR